MNNRTFLAVLLLSIPVAYIATSKLTAANAEGTQVLKCAESFYLARQGEYLEFKVMQKKKYELAKEVRIAREKLIKDLEEVCEFKYIDLYPKPLVSEIKV